MVGGQPPKRANLRCQGWSGQTGKAAEGFSPLVSAPLALAIASVKRQSRCEGQGLGRAGAIPSSSTLGRGRIRSISQCLDCQTCQPWQGSKINFVGSEPSDEVWGSNKSLRPGIPTCRQHASLGATVIRPRSSWEFLRQWMPQGVASRGYKVLLLLKEHPVPEAPLTSLLLPSE